MTINNQWQGRRYYPISQYFKNRFGEKTGKISVSVAERCPNRTSSLSTNSGKTPEACIFCDEWGSAAYHLERDRDLVDQIQHNKKLVSRRLKNTKFLVYFQSYTNTLDKIATLQQRFATALAEEDVCGLVIGTRPDCLPERLFALLDEVSQKTYLMIELGVQSFFNDQLEFLKRGHTAEASIDAIQLLAKRTHVDIGIHLMFGMPYETESRIIETAHIINRLPISNVKLHNLHVLKNTPLELIYHRGEFIPDELPEYAEKVILFLQHLSPQIAVQRLAALSNRWNELIAPAWTSQKMQPIEFIEGLMKERGIFQGDKYQQ